MAYLQRDEIKTPSDNAIVWRYSKFYRFEDMIKSKSLYFAPICNYDDPWEAAIPKSGLEWRHKKLLEAEKKGNDELQNQFREILKIEAWRINYTKAVKANCWHIGDSESEAMWKLYVGSEDGVVIKSSVKKIKSAISKTNYQIFIGAIHYVDYGKAEFNDIQWYDLCFHKRQAFAHENEMRLAFVNNQDILNQKQTAVGIQVPVEISTLIDEIYISTSNQDLLSKVVALLEEAKHNKKVYLSSLSLPPMSGLSLFKFVKQSSI